MKRIVRVCMGSACHVKGAPQVARALQAALEAAGGENEIEIMGRFCQDECQRGVVVQGPEKSWYRVEVADAPSIIAELLEGGRT